MRELSKGKNDQWQRGQTLRRHAGELRGMEDPILQTISAPDLVLQGYRNELLALKNYPGTPVGAKDMVVVYREDKRLIITAFLTSDRPRLVGKRHVIWLRRSR